MKKLFITLGVILVGVIAFNLCTYSVREDEVAVIQNLGNISGIVIDEEDKDAVLTNIETNNYHEVNINTNKGLHFKIPFIQTVEKFPTKYLTYKSKPQNINTRDKREIEIQIYAQYRIVDPIKFKLAVGSKLRANSMMNKRVYSAIVQPANSLTFDEFFSKEKINNMLEVSEQKLNTSLMEDFGLYAVDIGINRKNFPVKNLESIEAKMSKQIEKDSEKLKAEGDAEYNKKKAEIDKQQKQIIATAVEKAATIKAQADAESVNIYQQSLQKDLGFYEFIKRMDIYKGINGKTIFLDKDNDFLKYINDKGATAAPAN